MSCMPAQKRLRTMTGKPQAKVTNTIRRRSGYCTAEANYRQTRSIARPLCDSKASCLSRRSTYYYYYYYYTEVTSRHQPHFNRRRLMTFFIIIIIILLRIVVLHPLHRIAAYRRPSSPLFIPASFATLRHGATRRSASRDPDMRVRLSAGRAACTDNTERATDGRHGRAAHHPVTELTCRQGPGTQTSRTTGRRRN